MRHLSRILFVAAAIALVAFATGCPKKMPPPPAAPPVQQTPTPTPTPTPAPEPAPAPAPAPVTVGDLKTVFFALDSYTLDDASRATLDANAKLMRDHADLTARVEGHCDERGTVEYNMSLGQKRADAVRDYLVGAGVPAARLSTLSYGKERPLVDGHDESAWAKNRRAEFSKP